MNWWTYSAFNSLLMVAMAFWFDSIIALRVFAAVGWALCAVRYLRADLTCGECGNWRSDVPMLRNHCTKRGFYVERDEPFCGAFTPKKEGR